MEKRKVTNKENDYSYEMYMSDERWSSYFRQIDEIRKAEKAGNRTLNVLVVGVGNGFIPMLIRFFCRCTITTFDYDEKLAPDIVGDILELSQCVKERFDVILCCQVLEHIPYTEFRKALAQLEACLKDDGICIMSLPDSGCDLGGGLYNACLGHLHEAAVL